MSELLMERPTEGTWITPTELKAHQRDAQIAILEKMADKFDKVSTMHAPDPDDITIGVSAGFRGGAKVLRRAVKKLQAGDCVGDLFQHERVT